MDLNNTLIWSKTINTILGNYSSYMPEQVFVITDFVEQNSVDLYDFNLPASDPKNIAVLIALPLMTIGTLSIVVRTTSGVLALCTKGVSIIANVANEVTKAIDEGMEKTANKLRDIATGSFRTEVIATVLFTTAALGVIGLSMMTEATPFPGVPPTTPPKTPPVPPETFEDANPQTSNSDSEETFTPPPKDADNLHFKEAFNPISKETIVPPSPPKQPAPPSESSSTSYWNELYKNARDRYNEIQKDYLG